MLLEKLQVSNSVVLFFLLYCKYTERFCTRDKFFLIKSPSPLLLSPTLFLFPFPLTFSPLSSFSYFIFRKCLIKMYVFYIKKKNQHKNYKKREVPMAPTCFSPALNSVFPLSRYMLVIHIQTEQFQLQCLGYI